MNEVRFCLNETDLIWLAQRLAAVYPGCRSLSRREMVALCEVVAMQIPPDSINTAGNPGDIEAAARGLELLFETMGLQSAPWESEPRHGRLPMVALQPGMGCRVIYGRTVDGLWMIEVPGGIEQCLDLPEGGRYSAILAIPEKTDKSTKPTVPAMFRSALKVCKDLLFQVPVMTIVGNFLTFGACSSPESAAGLKSSKSHAARKLTQAELADGPCHLQRRAGDVAWMSE